MTMYLLEVGTEEIPAHFIGQALTQMKEIMARELSRRRIAFASVHALGTPRRLALIVEGISPQGEDQTEEVRGPAQKAAYDAEGKPTKALMGFAGSQGVSIESLSVKEVNGNTYVFAEKKKKGEVTALALPGVVADMIAALSFPKFMRWGDLEFRFPRPIRWLVSLMDDEVLPLAIAEVESGRTSRGHRFLSKGEFSLASASAYRRALEENFVIADQDVRKDLIRRQIEEIAAKNNCVVESDEELLEEVTHLLEWPTALMGRFNETYLEMPDEVVITPMREHQRYFPVRDKDGKLLNRFVTLRNGGDQRLDLVTEGNERVLAARLSDARFFWDEDRKQPLEAYLPKLEKVVFQEKLGTLGDKVRRIERLTAWLVAAMQADAQTKEDALRGAHLAKADLVTNMVFEFAELQGIMGRYYALECGERPEVAQVVLEHYQPRFAGDQTAASLAGAFVAIADKMDTIAGIFALGIEPTGSQDPYALRRAAMGICQTALSADLPLNLEDLILQALHQYMYILADEEAVADVYGRIMEFFVARIRSILSDEGHRYDVVDCVLAIPFARIQEAQERARTISKHRQDAGFRNLLAGFTRAFNLAKRSSGGKIDPSRFTEEVEMALHARILATQAAIGGVLEEQGLPGAVLALSNLAEPVNA
ncbi:MAG: glycine--tRNA ligase subunit beta, partial [Peptococcaceae bacterium]|nr:glycine--tRNA ligase subunit beta [Peptococcaceae bacterium]